MKKKLKKKLLFMFVTILVFASTANLYATDYLGLYQKINDRRA